MEMQDSFEKKYDRVLIWYVTKSCNFSCYQCAGQAKKSENGTVPEKINLPALKTFLASSKEILRFSFTGGEPFIVENIIAAMKEITERHYVSVITNLVSPRIKLFSEQVDPKKVSFITASAHMTEMKKRNLLDTFVSNCLLLNEKGFKLFISEVAYPYMANKAEEYVSYFKKYGLELEFMAFRGKWKGKNYPEDYTKQEIEIFNLNKSMHTRNDIFNWKGKPCNAGYNLAVVMDDGYVQPCFSIYQKLGNIYNGFQFNEYLIKCPFKYCPCPFPVFENYLYDKALEETGRYNIKNKGIFFIRVSRALYSFINKITVLPFNLLYNKYNDRQEKEMKQ